MALEILGEVGIGEGPDALERTSDPHLHAHQPKCIADALRHLGAGPVRPVEGSGQVLVELGAIGSDAGADGVEGIDREALGIGVGLEHQGWDRAKENGLGHPRRAVAAQVPSDLAAAGGVPYQDRFVEVEGLDELGAVVGVGVHLIAVPRLAGAPMAARCSSGAPSPGALVLR